MTSNEVARIDSAATKREMMRKGLPVDVYRAPTDTTLGGITSTHQRLTVIGVLFTNLATPTLGRIPQWCETDFTDEQPPVIVVIRQAFGAPYAFLEPIAFTPQGNADRRPGAMHGGNYAGTSYGMFREVLTELLGHPSIAVLPVHDRYEH
ncbi:hypothetical protein ACFWPX_30080 [Nocardia sp. NPDC058518]|uniref:hypothetical protein n=1 Tax=Nocardia sp. NPDC058518 TaxID=3346534 RepID=UPI0036559847